MGWFPGRITILLAYILSLLAVAILASKYTSSLAVHLPPKQIFSTDERMGAPLTVGALSVQISAEPRNININEISTITISVTFNNTPISGALVNLSYSGSSLGGSFNASQGVTNSDGKLAIQFTSKTAGAFIIYAIASKTGYEPGLNYTTVNVTARLSVQISAEPRNININEISTITISVTCGNTPISGALVKLTYSGGSLDSNFGATNSEGRLTVQFTSKEAGLFAIYAQASKAGYEPGLNYTTVNVTGPPRLSKNGTSSTEGDETTGGNQTTGRNQTSTERGSKLTGVTPSGCKKCSGDTTGKRRIVDDGVSSAEGGKGSETPLFRVRGLPRSPYLRTSPGEIYQAGIWTQHSSNSEKYSKAVIYIPSLASEILSIEIIPLVEIGGFLPVMRETSSIIIDQEILWFPSMMSFYLDGITTKPYTVLYVPHVHDEQLLSEAKCTYNPAMLQLSRSITNRTRELAIKITEGIIGDFQKAVAIRDYLWRNYIYDENYTPAPEGWDPIDWFLFEEKKGVCANFNSAFVILCRIVGIPARVVRGYLIKTDVPDQIVTENNAHCWAEVEFEKIGWVTFDATGGRRDRRETDIGLIDLRKELPKRVKTVTTILSQPSIVARGDTIFVSGTVRTVHGANVSGLYIFVYLVEDKNSITGTIIGSGIVENGLFNVTCRIPINHSIGYFQIVAKTSSNEYYEGSLSDPQIIVVSRSKLSVNWPERVFIGDSFEVSGTLQEDETGSPIPNATINISIENVNSTSVTTDSTGSFSAVFAPISRPGNYTILVSYAGGELRLPYETKGFIEVLNVNLEWLTETEVVRGEPWKIRGKVAKGKLGVEGAEVFFELDNRKIMSGKTDTSGNFEFSYEVSRNMSLGNHVASIILPEYGLSIQKIVTVFARTRIVAKFPEKIDYGKNLVINISLFDDFNQTLAEKELIITISSKSGTLTFKNYTNENGVLLVNVIPPMNQSVEAINVEIIFPGSDYYLYSQANGLVNVAHLSTTQPFFLLGATAAVLLSLTGIILVSKIRQPARNDSLPLEQEFRQMKIPERESVKKPEIYLVFPSIKDPLPLLWGVNDPLTFNVVCLGPISKESSLEVKVKENVLFFGECKREQSFVVSFPDKGVNVITAKIIHEGEVIAESRAMIKIVDYREEISSMHDLISNMLKEHGVLLENTLTLREEMKFILNYIGTDISGILVDFYLMLEKVNYSSMPISRDEYEKAYFLLHQIKLAFTSMVSQK